MEIRRLLWYALVERIEGPGRYLAQLVSGMVGDMGNSKW